MRILELEIENIRGIPHIILRPNGKNFLIWGPNGSGKSAVVDAVDFLLTGRISRLAGKGTKGITLTKHGPHIDHEPKEASVRASIQLRGYEDPLDIRRCIADPDNLQCDQNSFELLQPIIELAHRGQHVLTRRNILRYITAEANTRASQIQELLNLSAVEEIRKALVKADNQLKKEYDTSKRSLQSAKGQINATLQQQSFDEAFLLKAVNASRSVLGGKPLPDYFSANLKSGLTPPQLASTTRDSHLMLIDTDLQNLHRITKEKAVQEMDKTDQQLRKLLQNLASRPHLKRLIDLQRLVSCQLNING